MVVLDVKCLQQLIDSRMDPRPVALARILVGIALLTEASQLWSTLPGVYDPAHIRLRYLWWLPDLPESGIPILIGTWCLASLAFLVGWQTRPAGFLLSIVAMYYIGLDQQTYGNHVYLLAIMVLLLTLADCGACFSLDARNLSEERRTPVWPVLLLKIQLTIVYGFAALAKMNVIYISGAVLVTHLRIGGITPLPIDWQNLDIRVLILFALATILLEVFLALAFWSSRLRRGALIIGLAFHLGIMMLMPESSLVPLFVFTVQMGALYLFFFDLAPLWTLQHRLATRTRAAIGQPRAAR